MKSWKVFLQKSIVVIVTLQLLNIGLFNQTTLSYNSSIVNDNIINSVTEYIAEVLLKKQNAFPENNNQHNDKHSHNHHNIKTFDFKFLIVSKLNFEVLALKQNKNFCLYFNKYNPSIVLGITVPPPKHLA